MLLHLSTSLGFICYIYTTLFPKGKTECPSNNLIKNIPKGLVKSVAAKCVNRKRRSESQALSSVLYSARLIAKPLQEV